MIFQKSVKGRKGVSLPECDVPAPAPIPAAYRRDKDESGRQMGFIMLKP